MSKSIAISSEKIAEIKNALTVIQLNAQQVPGLCISKDRVKMTENVIDQVKRIHGLLPQIKYEKECKCYVTE